MRKVLCLLTLGTALFAAAALFAQEQPPAAGMEPPKPKFGPELARLSFLVGNFSSENMAHPSPMGNGGPGKGRNINRWDLDSIFLMFNYEGELAGMGGYKGKGMLTYDGRDGQYKCWWFDNFGSSNLYQGTFAGDTLLLEGEIPLPQGTLKEKIMWHPEGKKFKFRLFQDWGQGFNLAMEETATPSGAKTGRKK
ncbi:MAG TPA: DUF1579 family protein [Verrucomicrobiae bacterium]|nr:DUF1579 family protein [Verrucomicrobiae bacterium]